MDATTAPVRDTSNGVRNVVNPVADMAGDRGQSVKEKVNAAADAVDHFTKPSNLLPDAPNYVGERSRERIQEKQSIADGTSTQPLQHQKVNHAIQLHRIVEFLKRHGDFMLSDPAFKQGHHLAQGQPESGKLGFASDAIKLEPKDGKDEMPYWKRSLYNVLEGVYGPKEDGWASDLLTEMVANHPAMQREIEKIEEQF